MFNLENFLVQYATFNWQHKFIDFKLNQKAINIFIILFVFLIFITNRLFNYRKRKKVFSKDTQTEPEIDTVDDKSNISVNVEYNDSLLDSIFNHKYFRNYLIDCWIVNFNEFQFSKTVSKSCQIVEFKPENCDKFQISQIKIIDNEELITFTFQLKCTRLSLKLALLHESKGLCQADITMTDLEFSALAILRICSDRSSVKCFPDCVGEIHFEIHADDLTRREKEAILAEFRRDLKLSIMQSLEMEWGTHISESLPDNEVGKDDAEDHLVKSEIADTDNQDIETSGSLSLDDLEVTPETPLPTECSENTQVSDQEHLQKNPLKEMMSHTSLVTADSYEFYEQGEESPFHDRVSSQLAGRTLVVGLVKVVEAQELKNPLKSGYCVLELDEPYQRHVSHLISLSDYPIWNQHFVFSLNSNSQRLSVELFHASKKCQNPTSLGISVIPISLILVDPSENYFPINNNQAGSRKSWRCDVIAGGIDSKIPAFLIEFQIMKSIHELTKTPADHFSDISSSHSGMSVPPDNAARFSENPSADQESGGFKMQTIPESKTNENTLTKSQPNDEQKALLRNKPPVNENGRSKSLIRKLRHRFSRISVPWVAEKSKSDDCLDHLTDDPDSQRNQCSGIPIQPPAELFMMASKPKVFSKISDAELKNSRSLSISLKKVFNIPSRKNAKSEEKNLEQLFQEMDPKIFDTISNEGFNRIMNN